MGGGGLNSNDLEYVREHLHGGSPFYPAVFQKLLAAESSEISSLWNLSEDSKISFLIQEEGLQDPFKYRCMQRSIQLAAAILDQKGDLCADKIERVIPWIERYGYIPTPEGYSDTSFITQVLELLKKLRSNKGLDTLLRRCQLPLANLYIEQMIKDCLSLSEEHVLSNKDVRIAVLSACFYPLRQNVGSCFATAPAILIQKEQVENLITDLIDLLSIGTITRVIAGKEHSVPLSPSYGIGDLKKIIPHSHLAAGKTIPWSIKRALELVGVLSSDGNADEQRDWYAQRLSVFFSTYTSMTINDFFEFVVFAHFSVSKEDLKRFVIEEENLFKESKKSSVVTKRQFSDKQSRCKQAKQSLLRVQRFFLSRTEHFLARSWEYTIASFSEVKMEFSGWNLYSSLGLHPNEEVGLGCIIYQFIEKKLTACNQRLEELQRDYEIAFDQLRSTEILLRQASSESEGRHLQAEFHSRNYHMQASLDLRDRFYKKSSFYPHLLKFLIEQFDKRFPEYFQEIYDPEMQELKALEYEDSSAGFRLLYKHGRRDASVWSMIHTQEQFIDSLIEFFSYLEPQVLVDAEGKNCEEEILEIFSLMIFHIRTEEFIKTAFQRSSRIHRQSSSIGSGDAKERTPWAYSSGGVMGTLINIYYRREASLYEESFSVDGALDLLTLIIETMKSLPYNFTAYFPKGTDKHILMHSPNHAFLLRPYASPFFEAWDDNGFTYTWIRDRFLRPSKDFFRSQILSVQDQQILLDLFAKQLPDPIGTKLLFSIQPEGSIGVQQFVQKVLGVFPFEPLIKDLLDSFLYQSLPLIPSQGYKSAIYALLEEKTGSDLLNILNLLPDLKETSIPANTLRDWAKGAYLLFRQTACLDFDLHEYITHKSAALCLSPPVPLFFADTNWAQYYFAFVINPSSEELELWRVKESSFEGLFMRSWSVYFAKANKHVWSVYAKPQEYAQVFDRLM